MSDKKATNRQADYLERRGWVRADPDGDAPEAWFDPDAPMVALSDGDNNLYNTEQCLYVPDAIIRQRVRDAAECRELWRAVYSSVAGFRWAVSGTATATAREEADRAVAEYIDAFGLWPPKSDLPGSTA